MSSRRKQKRIHYMRLAQGIYNGNGSDRILAWLCLFEFVRLGGKPDEIDTEEKT